MNLWETQPYFVNDTGVRWWLDRSTTDYAMDRIKGAAVWIVEDLDGGRTRVLVIDGIIRYETTSLDSMGTHIDILKLQYDYSNHEKKAARGVPQGGPAASDSGHGGAGGDPGDRIAGHQGRAGSGETGVC